MRYLRLAPNSSSKPHLGPRPFAAIVVVEAHVNPEWQAQLSKWLVASGCLYMMAWGVDCSSWDDSVDYAVLATYDDDIIPDDKFVMTTWHENETLQEVFTFAKNYARPASAEAPLTEIVVLHIANADRQVEYEKLFAAA